MLELDTTVLTPAPVFEASGHVARFADWMVRDAKTSDVLRADHLVKNVLQARLAGDGEKADKKGKKDKAGKTKVDATTAAAARPVKVTDEIAKEYELVLAKVSLFYCLVRLC